MTISDRLSRSALPRGFSMIEAVMVMLIVAVVVGALTPSVIRQISHARVNRAASVVAAEFMHAQSLAGRQQAPVVTAIDGTAKTFTIRSQTGSTILVRHLGTTSEYKLTSLTSNVASVLVLPNGTASALITVTLGSSGYTRQVRMSRAGLIRVL